MSRKSQRIGSAGEDVAMMALRAKGVQMVEEIATPFAVVGTKKGGWVRIVRKKKVSGDLRGILPGGRRVLAEVKACKDRLPYSRLKQHQIEALNENHQLGGLSLLVMVSDFSCVVMEWPIDGFKPHSSIIADDAARHEWRGVV